MHPLESPCSPLLASGCCGLLSAVEGFVKAVHGGCSLIDRVISLRPYLSINENGWAKPSPALLGVEAL